MRSQHLTLQPHVQFSQLINRVLEATRARCYAVIDMIDISVWCTFHDLNLLGEPDQSKYGDELRQSVCKHTIIGQLNKPPVVLSNVNVKHEECLKNSLVLCNHY